MSAICVVWLVHAWSGKMNRMKHFIVVYWTVSPDVWSVHRMVMGVSRNLNLLTQVDKSSMLLTFSVACQHKHKPLSMRRWVHTNFNLLNLDKIDDEKVGVDWVRRVFEPDIHIEREKRVGNCHAADDEVDISEGKWYRSIWDLSWVKWAPEGRRGEKKYLYRKTKQWVETNDRFLSLRSLGNKSLLKLSWAKDFLKKNYLSLDFLSRLLTRL